MRRLRRLLGLLLRRADFERGLDEELRFHLDMRVEQLAGAGIDRAEARRRARLELGMQELHRDAARRAWRLDLVDGPLQALKLALRSLRRAPSYAITAVCVLAVPLALGVLLYALFSAYALQAPPVERPERWFYLDGRTARAQPVGMFGAAEAAALVARPPGGVEGLYSARGLDAALATDRDHRGMGEAVSDNFFALARLPASAGRLWWGDDDPRDRDTLLLSARGVEKLFGDGVDPIGRRVDVAGKAFSVIGVVGAGYSGLMPIGALYWIRTQDLPEHARFGGPEHLRTEIGGFTREGVSLDAVTAALSAGAAALTLERDAELQLTAIAAVQRRGLLREHDRAEAILAGVPVAILVLLILAVAAANLANLVLARFSSRRHDLALRAAIGASRRRLFLEMLAECMLLGQLAALLALLLVALLMQPVHDAVFGLISEFGFDLHTLHLGWDAALFCSLLGLLAAVGFGALPAWWLTAPFAAGGGADPDAAALKKSEPRGLRGGLMTLQLTGSIFLVVIAGLVASNARVTRDAVIGFDPEPMVALNGTEDGGRLARELALLPYVAGVSATSSVPFMQPLPRADAVRDGRSDRLQVRYVDAAWWPLLGIDLEAGRRFTSAEGDEAPVAIVSARAAQLLWPGLSPLGRSMRLQGDERWGWRIDRSVEVVGVARDVASGWLFGDPLRAVVYLPAQAGSAEAPTLLLKLRDASLAQVAALERDCLRIAPAASCRPMRMADALSIQRLPATVASRLSGALAWLALGISCLGLYGLVSYAIVRQRKELGVRLALGAQAGQVVRHVMRGAVRPLLLGLLIGLPIAWTVAGALGALTEHIRAFSLDVFVVQPLLLVAVALLACWLPARRSARIAPSECLRAD